MNPRYLSNSNTTSIYNLNPEKWIETYAEEFFQIVFKVINDRENTIRILKSTFLIALKNKNSFLGNTDEFSWLLSFLIDQLECYRNNLNYSIKSSNRFFLIEIPQNQKIAFLLKTFGERSTKNICHLLKINEKVFWKYIQLVRKQLVESLGSKNNINNALSYSI